MTPARSVRTANGKPHTYQQKGANMLTWEQYWKLESRLEGKQVGVPTESIIIKGNRQLFIDNYVVEHMDNLVKRLHQPVRHDDNPVIRVDRPWERTVGYATILHDEQDGCFKAWYATLGGLAYATSEDGLRWDKPNLAATASKTRSADNLVFPCYESVAMKDPLETSAEKRYKIMFFSGDPYGVYIAYSPDGIQWTTREAAVITHKNDPGLNDHPTWMIDTARKRYLAFTKREINNPFGRGDWGMIHRMRCVSVSEDFENWTDPVLTLRPDDRDDQDLQIYGMSGFNYEGMYIGVLEAYHSGGVGPYERTIDLQLACSRDGEVWWRAGDRRTFLPLGPDGAFDQFTIVPTYSPPIQVGNELWLYYTGNPQRHRRGLYPEHRRREPWNGPGHPEPVPQGVVSRPGEPGDPIDPPGPGIGLARLRVAAFVSVDAGPRPGQLLTRPLVFDGNALHVNVDAKGGCVTAEVYQAEPVDTAANGLGNTPTWNWKIGEPIDGFSLRDCLGVRGDTTDGIIRWTGDPGLSRFSDRYIVIRFQLVNASLYSFWIG